MLVLKHKLKKNAIAKTAKKILTDLDNEFFSRVVQYSEIGKFIKEDKNYWSECENRKFELYIITITGAGIIRLYRKARATEHSNVVKAQMKSLGYFNAQK